MRIWGGGAAGSESSWITIAVFSGDAEELWRESLKTDQRKHRSALKNILLAAAMTIQF